MQPEILLAIVAAAAVLLITYGLAAKPPQDAVQARLSQLVVQFSSWVVELCSPLNTQAVLLLGQFGDLLDHPATVPLSAKLRIYEQVFHMRQSLIRLSLSSSDVDAEAYH